jgi:serine/threonine protein kinase
MHTTVTAQTLRDTLELIDTSEAHYLVTVDIGYQPTLERDVVIKRLSSGAATDPRLRGRFVREMRDLASLSHHGIVRVYDAGLDDDVPYVVLEKLSGMTVQQRLDQLLDQRARMSLDEVLHIIGNVADVVAYANQHHVALHDLTPTNIVLSHDQRIVLAEPGQPLPENLLKAPTAALAYAAPEKLLGGIVDTRSDVYALGVLLAHLMFGQLPFEGSAIGIIAQKQNGVSLPILNNLYELACPPTLAHIMRQATAQQPNHRYANVEAFRTALTDAVTLYPSQLQLTPGQEQRPAPMEPSANWNAARPAQYAQQPMPQAQPAAQPQQPDPAVAWTYPQPQPAPAPEPEAAAPMQQPVQQVVNDVQPGPQARQKPLYQPPMVEEVPAEIYEEEPVHAEVIQEEQAARPTVTPDITVIDWETMDPLMPGRDDPALHAALPYTILVPMPTAEEVAEAAASLQTATPAAAGSRNYIHLIAMIMLGVMAVSAAMMFG